MRRQHRSTLKFHTIYSATLATIFIIAMFLLREIALGLAMLFLLMYVAGNGIIHSRSNKLTRDTLIEYILVALVVLVLLLGMLL